MRQIVRWSRLSSGRTGGPNRYRKRRNLCSRFDTGNCHSTDPWFMWCSFGMPYLRTLPTAAAPNTVGAMSHVPGPTQFTVHQDRSACSGLSRDRARTPGTWRQFTVASRRRGSREHPPWSDHVVVGTIAP